MNIPAARLRVDAIMVSAAVLMTVAAGAIAIGPKLLSRGPTAEQQIQELDAHKRRAAALDQQLDGTRAGLAALQVQSQEMVHLESAGHVNQRLERITQLAEESRVSIVQMAPSQSPPPAPAGAPGAPTVPAVSLVIPIRLSGTGSYPAVTRFLHAVHQQLRDTAVIGVHMNAAPGDRPTDNVGIAFGVDLAWHTALRNLPPRRAPRQVL